MNFSTEQHWRYFAEFARWEKASGGPDPQLAMVAKMSEGVDRNEMLWRAGCYIAVYNVPFAEVLWQHWSYEGMVYAARRTARTDLEAWLTRNWSRITTRVERRCVRRPDWMRDFLLSYFAWQENVLPALLNHPFVNASDRYEAFWGSCQQVKFLGRYVALKLLEFYQRYCGIDIDCPDIRPKDGWSPRRTLSVLFPEHALPLNDGRGPGAETLANRCAESLQTWLVAEHGVMVSLFELQVLLCEYRESYEGNRQYPGRSLDSELGYHWKARNHWDFTSELLPARRALFPAQHLGELNGWTGARKELGRVLSTHGYTWSDLKYQYKPGGDLSHPEEWKH